jgi:hypothetical protein
MRLVQFGESLPAEISALLRDPLLTPDQVIELVKAITCSGCGSGKELVNANRSPLAYLAYTGAAANAVLHHADVASLNQTFGGATLRRRIPKQDQFKLPDSAQLQKLQKFQLDWLLRRLHALSDPRSRSANVLADEVKQKSVRTGNDLLPIPGNLLFLIFASEERANDNQKAIDSDLFSAERKQAQAQNGINGG